MLKIFIKEDTCIKCGNCVEICYARDVFEMTETGTAVKKHQICSL